MSLKSPSSSQIHLTAPQFKEAISSGVAVVRFTENNASATKKYDAQVHSLIDAFRGKAIFYAIDLDHPDNHDDGKNSLEVDEMLRMAEVKNRMPHIAIFDEGEMIWSMSGSFVHVLREKLDHLLSPPKEKKARKKRS